MNLRGKAIFTCPKTGKDVTLHVECTNADGKGNNCVFFKHWGWSGSHPTLGCDYKQEPTTEEKPKEETLEEEQEEEGERDWRDPTFIDEE